MERLGEGAARVKATHGESLVCPGTPGSPCGLTGSGKRAQGGGTPWDGCRAVSGQVWRGLQREARVPEQHRVWVMAI